MNSETQSFFAIFFLEIEGQFWKNGTKLQPAPYFVAIVCRKEILYGCTPSLRKYKMF
jgi:hypothetical protein